MQDYVKPVLFVVLIVLVSGATGGVMAANRGRNVEFWSVLCALLPPCLLLIFFAKPLCEVEGKFRRCLDCSQLIKWHEPVCKYCHSEHPAGRG